MYLMNVPPVAATHTEWRACGPHRGYSAPNFFNDSDTELSTRGTPISDKVQMIIESLRSSQSSVEMGDEMEGNSLSGQKGQPQVCKAAGSYIGAKSKTKGPAENKQTDVSCPNIKSSDSDSDDSVDRGIEEAILEYLKEKDDHKRKAEPCLAFLQPSKISRKTPPIPEVSTQNYDGNTSNQFPKSVKDETHPTPIVVPIKKYIKNRESLNDNIVRKLESNKITATKGVALPKAQTKSSTTISLFSKIKCPVTVKVEDNSNDSSSDDGIEEAIQRYQLEKKEQQNKGDASDPPAVKEESDSTSDDGIEEAIRCYKLEQLEEKGILKPFLHKQNPLCQPLMHTVGNTSVENSKKHKLRKKKTRTGPPPEPVHPPPSSIFIPHNTLSDSSISEGNGFHLFQDDNCKTQPPPVPKANTTAELMCAEAILDISKTVIPEAFHHGVDLSSGAPAESSIRSSFPGNCPAEESDGSSVDSEDGIEQEIMKFLEQKAQMQQQPPSSATCQEPRSENGPEIVKTKQVAVQKKPSRLSLAQEKKLREENLQISTSGTDTFTKQTAHNLLPEDGKESNPTAFFQRSQKRPAAGLQKREQSGDKSSSLDSDEDLDTAIKDLLKTKKKSKKKNRDLKRNSRKHSKDEEPMLENALQTKKFKPDPMSRHGALRKVQKGKDDPKAGSGSSEIIFSQDKQTNTNEDHVRHEVEARKFKTESQDAPLLQKEDSSSVDSDDSIELEIRRFLAEKAKVSTAEKGKDGDASRNGTALSTPLQVEDIKRENQLAEIPRKSIGPLSGQSPLSSQPLPIPQSLPPVISAVCAQSPMTSVQSGSPRVLEPADGAGAARTVQRRPSPGQGGVQDMTTQTERLWPVLSPNVARSQSESIKWRQSLGLPITNIRTPRRNPFHITSSKIRENASAAPKVQSAAITPKPQTACEVWSSARTSRAPIPCSAEATANAAFRSPVVNVLSTARQHPRMSFTQSPEPSCRSQSPVGGERESMVHVPKDKSVFVELESNRTNHVQVQSDDRGQGKERVDMLREIKHEAESLKIDGKQVHLERADEEFIDEAECESGNRTNPEKKQGFSTLSLSRAIDPGMTFRPCIALTTEERSMMFNGRHLAKKCTKGLPFLSRVPVLNEMKLAKRKLQFVSVNRRNEAPSSCNGITKNHSAIETCMK